MWFFPPQCDIRIIPQTSPRDNGEKPGGPVDNLPRIAYNKKVWMEEYSPDTPLQRAAGWCKAAVRRVKLASGASRFMGGCPRYRARVGRSAANKSGTAKGNAFRLLWGGGFIFGMIRG